MFIKLYMCGDCMYDTELGAGEEVGHHHWPESAYSPPRWKQLKRIHRRIKFSVPFYPQGGVSTGWVGVVGRMDSGSQHYISWSWIVFIVSCTNFLGLQVPSSQWLTFPDHPFTAHHKGRITEFSKHRAQASEPQGISWKMSLLLGHCSVPISLSVYSTLLSWTSVVTWSVPFLSPT